jgi:hypothetical protein
MSGKKEDCDGTVLHVIFLCSDSEIVSRGLKC